MDLELQIESNMLQFMSAVQSNVVVKRKLLTG